MMTQMCLMMTRMCVVLLVYGVQGADGVMEWIMNATCTGYGRPTDLDPQH